ncbi:MAG TPA: hypothetical protein DCW74_01500 [Alteromonas australica]|uniref:HTH cro/C1-type domain-containing protein n=1 Tax=Alteromonas australica TaxID=589873 RepID=A0A350NZC4_9ALTE|nr:hypothetical protein [Alteromonas australica]|tara:strand:+ start:764 stop:970 length:207 start_codon:yes stop_codon:yes gene_type:complete
MIKSHWIGSLIKEERVKLKLTQKELSRQTGIGVNTLSSIEQGFSGVALEKIEKVLSELGWELDAHPYD